MKSPKKKVIAAWLVSEPGDFHRLDYVAGRVYYLLASDLVYDIAFLIDGKIVIERVTISAGFVTDLASMTFYAAKAILSRLGLWVEVVEPAVLHDSLPREVISDAILREAMVNEQIERLRKLRGKISSRALRFKRLQGFVQRWVMWFALQATFSCRSLFAGPPPSAVMALARAHCKRINANFSAYSTPEKLS